MTSLANNSATPAPFYLQINKNDWGQKKRTLLATYKRTWSVGQSLKSEFLEKIYHFVITKFLKPEFQKFKMRQHDSRHPLAFIVIPD